MGGSILSCSVLAGVRAIEEAALLAESRACGLPAKARISLVLGSTLAFLPAHTRLHDCAVIFWRESGRVRGWCICVCVCSARVYSGTCHGVDATFYVCSIARYQHQSELQDKVEAGGRKKRDPAREV